MPEPSARRKKPPSFPHVHPSRARIFKKAWVEKAKITSKWNAQKKKEGLMEKAKLEPQYGFEERVDPDNTNISHRSNGAEPAEKEGPAETTQHWRSNQREEQEPDEDDVRELMREAYSKSTLHTFKSDPLKKRPASGRKGEKGKGQPNMKLRMNALLAKIKRDCT